MDTLWPALEKILLQVQNPSQYIGGEWNTVVKDHSQIPVKIALAFPDTYHIGMSHLGLQILYGIVNAREDALAERVFAPWLDMESVMRREGIPLFSLETHTPVKNFDVVGFSVQQELCYTNILNMLSLAGIPLLSEKRGETDPLIIAGGPGAFAPEPLADFIDLFIIGDGEEKIVSFINELQNIKKETPGLNRKEIIKRLVTAIPGLYAPVFYHVSYHPDGAISEIKPTEPDIPASIPKALVQELDKAFYPVKPVVPFAEVVHNRISLEIMRGCPHACRFCESGVIKSPIRYRSVAELVRLAEESYRNTGYDEISLLSLSSGDYPWLDELMLRLNARFKMKKVGLSLPSLRIDERLKNLPGVLNAVRKSGLTLAPEAGRAFLRKIINKDIEDENLFASVRSAYQQGWRLIKLYFMLGLPRETDEDIEAIAQMLQKISFLGKEITGHPGNVNVTISPFVPKPHTPFQWAAMDSIEMIKSKQSLLRRLVKSRQVRLKFHQPERSMLEGVFARGDRRLGRALLAAHQAGCKFDSWDEVFDFNKWLKVFKECGIDPAFYLRARDVNEILPWDHIGGGISKENLLKDRAEALAVEIIV
ncbi:MAG: TIGR03960 family B12-binding radical SAM protein [Planctomycetota bacterium]